MKAYFKLFALVYSSFFLLTMVLNQLVFVEFFKVLNEPVNPLQVNYVTIVCLIIGVPVISAIAFIAHKCVKKKRHKKLYFSIVCALYILVLYFYFPLDKPSTDTDDDVNIIIHK